MIAPNPHNDPDCRLSFDEKSVPTLNAGTKPGRRRSLLNRFFFVLIAAPALVWIVQERIEIAKLDGDYRAIAPRWGELEITDPNKFHVRLIPGSTPQLLIWRIYWPPVPSMAASTSKNDYQWNCSSGANAGGFEETIKAEVVQTVDRKRSIRIVGQSRGFGFKSGIDDIPTDAQPRIVGEFATQIFESSQVVPLLVYLLPKDEAEKGPSQLNDPYPIDHVGQLSIGSLEAFAKLEEQIAKKKRP